VADGRVERCPERPDTGPLPDEVRPTKLNPATEMILLVARRFPHIRIVVTADHLYSGRAVLKEAHDQVDNVVFVMRGRADAAMHEAPPPRRPGQKGRPRVKGAMTASLGGTELAIRLADDEGMDAEQIRAFLRRLRADEPELYDRIFLRGSFVLSLQARGQSGFDGSFDVPGTGEVERYQGGDEGFFAGLQRTRNELGARGEAGAAVEGPSSYREALLFELGFEAGAAEGGFCALVDVVKGLWDLVVSLPELYGFVTSDLPQLVNDPGLRFEMGAAAASSGRPRTPSRSGGRWAAGRATPR